MTDIAGFAAATLLRGVRWAAVPTTLLAMVDASVGGKTGVDLGPAKNAVGAFHQPLGRGRGRGADGDRERRARSRAGWPRWSSPPPSATPPSSSGSRQRPKRVLRARAGQVVEVALRSVAVKAAIVARDERESGDRALLNFGHTVGHALEAEGGFARLTHGEAVSLGMVAALRVGVALRGDARPSSPSG